MHSLLESQLDSFYTLEPDPQIHTETQRAQNSQDNHGKKKNEIKRFTYPRFKTCYKATVIKQCGTSIRKDNQWNRIENPEINPHIYGQMTFDKGVKTIQWRKNSLFNG